MSESKIEEALASLKLISGLLAWIGNLHWLAWTMFVWAGLDALCYVGYAISEIAIHRADLKEKLEKLRAS